MQTWQIVVVAIIIWIGVSTVVGRRRHKVTRRPDNDLYRRVLEVTSRNFCPGCGAPIPGAHAAMCPRCLADKMMTDLPKVDDRGELMPAAMSLPPNIGGEGNPPYKGPHYESVHGIPDRFVPYDMLDEPIPGTAVHKVGNTAIAGPLEDKGEH